MLHWFSNPGFLWLGLLAGPVVLLFMLRHKPVVRRVSSTLLWAGAAQLNIATSPISKLQKSLSLLLNLLLLACLVLALSGLRIPDARKRGLPLVLIIDTTASMQTRTLDGSRLDLALARAREVIDAAGDSPITLMTWNGSLLLAAPADCEPSLAKAALGRIEATDMGAGDEALLLALRPHFEAKRAQRIALISDHRPGSVTADYLFVPAGPAAVNVGFVAADVHDAGKGQADLFFGLELFGDERSLVSVKLERLTAGEDQPQVEVADVRELTLARGPRTPVSFRVSQPGLYRARIESEDALAIDSQAYLRYAPPRSLAVACAGPMPRSLGTLLSALEFVTVVDAASADESTTAFIFSDGTLARRTRLPAAYLGPQSKAPGVQFSAVIDASEFAARPARSFLWRGAGVPDLRLGAVSDIQSAGFFQPVLEAGTGVSICLLARDNEALSDLIVGFDLDHEANNFRSKYAFVIFWSNWFEHVRGLLEPLPRGAVRTVDTLEVRKLDGRSEFSYRRAGAQESWQTSLPGDVLAADRVGVLHFQGLRETAEPLLGISLLDPGESNTAAVSDATWDAAAAREFLTAANPNDGDQADYDLRPWLALAALALLMFDWFYFRRRFALQQGRPPVRKSARGATAIRRRQAGA